MVYCLIVLLKWKQNLKKISEPEEYERGYYLQIKNNRTIFSLVRPDEYIQSITNFLATKMACWRNLKWRY
jgi:hypothetical protein